MISIRTKPREPNGRHKRPSLKEIEAAQKEREQQEKRFVLSQPHRRGDGDQFRAHPADSYVISLRTEPQWDEACKDAYSELRGIVRRWRLLVGLTDPEHPRNGEGLATSQMDDEAIRKLESRWYDAISYVRHHQGSAAAVCVQSLCVDYKAPPEGQKRNSVAGLLRLAKHFGMR